MPKQKKAVPEVQNNDGQQMRRKGQEKRQRLIDATVALLGRSSLSALRMADIAREAGTSMPNFYLYFKGTLDVVFAAVEQCSMASPEVMEALEPPWTPAHLPGHARRFVDAYLAHWQAHGPVLRARAMLVAEGDERFIAAEGESALPVLLALTARFDDLVPGRQRPGGFHATSAAGVLLAMLDRLASYLPGGPNVYGVTATSLTDAATRMVVLAASDARAIESEPRPRRANTRP